MRFVEQGDIMQSENVKKNQSVGKALQIIEALSDFSVPVRLHELSKVVSMPQSTVLRFLNTMAEMGYVTQDTETLRYSLTFKLAQIGNKILNNVPYQRIVHPFLEEVSGILMEPVSLTIEQDKMVVYIDKVDGPDHTLKTLQRIGKIAPMHSTGAGKILLLNYSQKELESFIDTTGLPSFTHKTITQKQQFIDEMAQVKNRGYAYDNEECELGVKCIAFPIRDLTGKIIAAMSISAPITRFTPIKEKQIIDVLDVVSRKASVALGWSDKQ